MTVQSVSMSKIMKYVQELGSAVRELEDSGAKALVLTSAQPTVFCSGLDIM